MSWGLAWRIFEHLFEQGWLKEGDLVADPFGGIGVTGLMAASFDCPCILVELEQKFVDLANKSFELHYDTWDKLGKPRPIILQGDSRQFSTVIREVARVIVTSPPYSESSVSRQTATMFDHKDGKSARAKAGGKLENEQYGRSAGQIGAMKEGNLEEVVEAILTSPPYSESLTCGGHLVWKNQGKLGAHRNSKGLEEIYGTVPGQIGNLPEGNHEAVVQGIVKSPPFSQPDTRDRTSVQEGSISNFMQRACTVDKQGSDERNIAKEQGVTYWQAVARVYQECWKVLKPSGVMVVVVKAFVRKGQIIDLPKQTEELLRAIGFVLLERIRAWLVSPAVQKALLPGVNGYRKERKSFFRRLAERKGAPRIDYEVVLFLRKPANSGV